MRRDSLALLLTLLAVTTIYGQSAKIKGRVLDSTGSVMPGVQIKLYQNDKVVKEGTSTGTGEFEVAAEPGDYKLELAAPDFNTYTEMVKVTSDMGPLSITMALAQIVMERGPISDNEISIDPDSSLQTTDLGKDFIEALPDNEDEQIGRAHV